ncbi:integral membrane protein [Cohnella thailandensis]|nr:integral membrane protein [Cohnella thailandensis]
MSNSVWQYRSMKAFTIVGRIEAWSFLILLGIAMPLKYGMDVPEAVTVVGALHGFLFALYLIVMVGAAIVHRWSIGRVLMAFVAAFLPFGPFIVDKRIRKSLAAEAG